MSYPSGRLKSSSQNRSAVIREVVEVPHYKFDWPDLLSLNVVQKPADREQFLAAPSFLTRPILVAMTATLLIPETWRAALDLLLTTLDAVTAGVKGGKNPAVGMEPELPVC